jgi:hypothetical protein
MRLHLHKVFTEVLDDLAGIAGTAAVSAHVAGILVCAPLLGKDALVELDAAIPKILGEEGDTVHDLEPMVPSQPDGRFKLKRTQGVPSLGYGDAFHLQLLSRIPH